MDRIKSLIRISKRVIEECSLDNGGIVAANSTKNYYPSKAKNYYYIWIRDASYACIASDIIGINDVQENFFNWCMNYAEGFKKSGLFYEKYYPNGLKVPNSRFQPDQTGTFLYALWHHYNFKNKQFEYPKLISIAADGICNVWDTNHFTINTNDLWEERLCFPDLQENFTYSLAACIKGLRCVNELLPNEKWIKVAMEMKTRLDEHYIDYFVRSFGRIIDKSIDASIIGLAYPFDIYVANDTRMIVSINEIEDKLSINGGIHRYEHDVYDVWMSEGEYRNKGAGAWCLLNFWMTIYFKRKGDVLKAKHYFNWVLDRINDNGYITEQIFDNDIQVSVYPLLWSHAMFIIASKELNLL